MILRKLLNNINQYSNEVTVFVPNLEDKPKYSITIRKKEIIPTITGVISFYFNDGDLKIYMYFKEFTK